MNLYYSILSSYAQKALLAFYEKGVDFTPVKVNLMDPVAKAEYRKIYPMGKVPLLVGEGVFIPESSIIIEYLEDEFGGQGARLIPQDNVAARKVRFMDRMADLYINDKIGVIFFDSIRPPEKRNPDAVAAARDVLNTSYNYLEGALAGKTFICGDTLSMADLALWGPLFYGQKVHPFTDKPNLTAYLGRMMQRESVQKVMAELAPTLQAMQAQT